MYYSTVLLYSVVSGIILLYCFVYSLTVLLLLPFAYGLVICINHCTPHLYSRITFLYLPSVSNSVVCLFVLPLQGRILLLLYFVNRLTYIICNIKFGPSWFSSIPPPGK